ncbi:MAG: TonB-dependent receptor plug domain-containing protein [Verrucomicrobiota bacterium]
MNNSQRWALMSMLFATTFFFNNVYSQGTDGQTSDEDLPVLEAFIAEETAEVFTGNLLPTSRPIDTVMFDGMSIVDLPRSVTVLTPEAIDQYDVQGFDDLTRVGAGFSRPNIFGIPGAPFIRGSNAGIFLNGNRRIFNQNETPTSFGSLEAIDLVKGPAPVQFGPTNAGGYANFIPKSPYFDKFRGSIELTVGEYDLFRVQADIGGPLLVSENIPMAYRISITQQQSESFYNDVGNDYTSIYGSAKFRINDRLRLFTGAEFFDFKSNENAGWNRVTQDLIDNDNYIIGFMDPNTTASFVSTGPIAGTPIFGTADLGLIDGFFPQQNATTFDDTPFGLDDPNLALVVPFAIFQERFGAPSGLNGAYAGGDSAAAQATIPIFDPVTNQLVGYKYTPDYFTEGGEVFTTKIDGDQVLSDGRDFANSTNAVWFADLVFEADPDFEVTWKSYFEYLETRKVSSYGFSHYTDSFAFRQKLVFDQNADLFGGFPIQLNYGVDFSYEEVDDINDFFVEPFNRRDISTGQITPQSIVLSGPDIGWAYNEAFGGAGSALTTLRQFGAFLQTKFGVLDDKLMFLLGARAEIADYTIENSNFIDVPANKDDGGETFYNGSGSIVFRPIDPISFYATVQLGTVFQPDNAGGVSGGDANFNEAELYEAGVKVSAFDDKLFMSLAGYYWDKTTVANVPIGTTSDAIRAEGVEFESNWMATENLTVVFNIAAQRQYFRGGFPFTTAPQTDEQVALFAGAIQYDVVTADRYANNPEQIAAGQPEVVANLFAIYQFKNGFGFSGGPTYRDAFWNDNERTIKLPSVLEWNGNIFYKGERFEAYLRFKNITDEDYFIGSSFAPNMIVTKAEPFNMELSMKWKF